MKHSIALLLVAASSAFAVEQEINAIVDINDAGAKSQQVVDELVLDTQAMLAKFQQNQAQLLQLERNNAYLQSLIDDQTSELALLNEQLAQIDATNQALVPLMQDMLARLEQIVELDLPFQRDERLARIAEVKSVFGQSDIGLADKYRAILEAYQIESNYGRSIESYLDEVDGKQMRVLRLGRLGLYALSLSEDRVYHYLDEKWQISASTELLQNVKQAIAMAEQARSPELLSLPLSVEAK